MILISPIEKFKTARIEITIIAIGKIDDQNLSDDCGNDDEFPVTRGIVSSSWSFQYATYPYLYARDDATVFLGKCYLLG